MTAGRRSTRARLAALLVTLGLVVAAVVALVSGSGAEAHCGIDPHGRCAELVQTLSMRMGLVVGAAAVLMLLVVAGLLRMVAHDEARREGFVGAPAGRGERSERDAWG